LLAGGAREIVLVAQDLAWYGRDVGEVGALAELLERLDALAGDGLARQRLLYLYPSEVRAPLLDRMLELPTVVPYFDLSLQHASAPLLRRMKRWGSGDRFLETIASIRSARPDAAFRSSFICGFPGETEVYHDELLAFLEEAQLDWAGFFPFSREDGTAAAVLDGEVPDDVVREWLRDCADVQEPITTAHRLALLGAEIEVLVDGYDGDVAIGRSHREAPEIDGVVRLDGHEHQATPGRIVTASVTDVEGPDLDAVVVR
jgi:tRNA A37 methylthiotransferase MiaB